MNRDDKFLAWEKLIFAARMGSRQSYEVFLKELNTYNESIIGRKLKVVADREDVLQEVLLAVHKALPTYDEQKPLKPWLNAILNYKVNDYLRARYKDEGLETLFDLPSAVPEVDGLDLEFSLGQLSEQQRDVFMYAKYWGFTGEEIELKTGLSQSNIKTLTHRAISKLKSVLRQNE